MSDFRSAIGSDPTWHATDGAFSNFEFVDTRFESNSILRRVLSLARKLGYQGMLEEKILPESCSLLREEDAALAVRLPDFQHSAVVRLSFFTGATQGAPGDFLGYAIIKQDYHAAGPFMHVFEAVLRPPRGPKENNYSHCQRTFHVRAGDQLYSVSGVLYAQQNDATFVCAHVALRTMLSCVLPQGDVSYAQLNAWAGVDHANPATQAGTRGHGAGGLTSEQVERILHHAGLHPELIVNEPNTPGELPDEIEFQKLLYGYLESGRPVMLGFELGADPVNHGDGRHIIPIFGHTFNEDLWAPEAERFYFRHNLGYFTSESWLSSYLAHDDNFGPYVCLPRHYLRRDQFRLLVGLKPAGLTVPPDSAEAWAFDFANNIAARLPSGLAPWLDRQIAFTQAQLLVLRPLQVKREHYLTQMRASRDRDGFDIESAHVATLAARLPETFWLVEISAPELFPSSRRKFGEVLIAAELPDQAIDPVLMLRAPGVLVFPTPTGIETHRTRLRGHTDLFRLS
ncbi:MAG: hypothetical protein HYV96_07315 [Opitutae bacterium]|nr:hypothetical protein [Opitutae bacterium]